MNDWWNCWVAHLLLGMSFSRCRNLGLQLCPSRGCAISSGRVVKGKVRIRRRKDVLFEGIIQSLRRFQDEVNEVRAGMECGIRIDGYNDFQIGDVIESYTTEKVAAKL